MEPNPSSVPSWFVVAKLFLAPSWFATAKLFLTLKEAQLHF
jgi:hypothetical protein